MSRKGILLLNLGSPKSTAVPDVRDYLREFLNDDRVIDYPAPLRWLLLEGIILRTRPKKSAAAYASVWTPEGSPLVVTTDRLRAKLEKATGLPVIMGMRYGTPSCAEAVEKVLAAGIDDLFVMPQYPHYAMSSYETVVVRVMEEVARQAPALKVTTVQPFFADPDYIAALHAVAAPQQPRSQPIQRAGAIQPCTTPPQQHHPAHRNHCPLGPAGKDHLFARPGANDHACILHRLRKRGFQIGLIEAGPFVFVADHIVQILDQTAEIGAVAVYAERVGQGDACLPARSLAQFGGTLEGGFALGLVIEIAFKEQHGRLPRHIVGGTLRQIVLLINSHKSQLEYQYYF